MHADAIAHLFDMEGPFASVLVDVSQDSEDGSQQREERLTEVLGELESRGAPASVVATIRERLEEPVDKLAPIARLLVATETEVCLDDLVQERVRMPVATWSPLPDVAPWVTLRDASIPFLLVVADREGSDIEVYSASTREPSRKETVHGERDFIHKVNVGGWSQGRYQNSTEEVWHRNAKQTGEIIDRYVARGMPLVILAGDERARVEIAGVLSTRASEHMVQVEAGGRAAGSSRAALEEAVAEVLRGEVVARRLDRVHEFQERKGRRGAVATSVEEVLDAFVLGQVDTLLLDAASSREQAVRPAEHRGLNLGLETSAEVPLDQALICAAARTAADVVVVPPRVLGGSPAAALLRWDQSSR